MTRKRVDSAEEVLKDPDIAKVRKMGITDYAIVTYVGRVRQGVAKEAALDGLLQGRSLTDEQIALVQSILDRFVIRPPSSPEEGYFVLEPAIVAMLDWLFDSENLFLGCLLLIISPVLTWACLSPDAILYLMWLGVLGAAGAQAVQCLNT